MSSKFALLFLLMLSLVPALPVRAQDPETLREGPFEPTILQVAKEGAAVRSEPGFLFKQLRTLEKGQQVSVVRRQGSWLRVRSGGWVAIADLADGSRPLPSEQVGTVLRVTSEGVRLRGGAGTGHPVIGTKGKGDQLIGLERQGDWWRLESGGWVFSSLVEEQGPAMAGPDSGGGSGRAAATPARQVRRWSYMDLNGTLFEILEVDKRARFLAGLRQAMRETGVLEDDWTYLRLVISVQEGQRSFRYSPAPRGNPVSVVALEQGESKRFGSVYVQGPVDRIPVHLRGFFKGQEVNPGERFEGLLMFRPTLDPARIESVQMLISGRPRTFFESE